MPGAPSLRVSRYASFIHSKSMTWCSVDSATPRFVLASSAIRCRFVDRFVRLKVLSRVSRQRFSPHGTPLPSIGSRRVRFPDVSGRIEVLRLPVTHPRHLFVSLPDPGEFKRDLVGLLRER